jgi:SnoaL-like domain
MSQTADSATVSADSLQELTDRLRITDLVSTLGRCLDERSFDSLRALFTEDATVSTPGGTAAGHEALVAQARRRHSHPEGIQHLVTNTLVELDGDRASVRANLLVTFAEGVADPAPYQLGEVYRMQLVRAQSGWRISDLSTTPTWSLNAPPR